MMNEYFAYLLRFWGTRPPLVYVFTIVTGICWFFTDFLVAEGFDILFLGLLNMIFMGLVFYLCAYPIIAFTQTIPKSNAKTDSSQDNTDLSFTDGIIIGLVADELLKK